MKIIKRDLERWKENTLVIARDMSLKGDILTFLEGTPVEIIRGESGSMFFGYAHYQPPCVEVFEINPSRHFPSFIREMWNQSGMDHELIGHLYNFYAGFDCEEPAARKTQVEMARHRAKDSLIWKVVIPLAPAILKFKEVRTKLFYQQSK